MGLEELRHGMEVGWQNGLVTVRSRRALYLAPAVWEPDSSLFFVNWKLNLGW